ncbi:MAG TPA: MFS transporter [Acidimicrobiia bacterium]|nr:MFS transporter [Acidimicrobiia bacterium]
MPAAPPVTVDFSKKWMVLATVGSGVLLATIGSSIVNVALPTITHEFDTTFRAIQWVPLAYVLVMATLTLGTGRLGDIVGKKRIYTSGFALFTIASALCGLSTSVAMLVGFRILQAIGAVMIISLGAAILTEAFPASERGKALGFIGTFVSIGIITGPAVGGVLISFYDWRSIFLVNIPVGVVGVLLAIRHVPNTPPVPNQRIDLPGMLLLSGALLSFSYAVTRGQEAGFTDSLNLTLFAMAAVLFTVWILVERRAPSPMIRLDLFRNPMLSVSVATGFMMFTLVAPLVFLMPFYLEGVLGYDIRTVGLLLGAMPLTIGIVAPMAGALSDRIGIRKLTVSGLVIVTIAFLGFQALTDSTRWWQYVLITVPLGLGMGTFQSPNNSAIMGSMPREYAGLGAGVLTITRLLGQVTGISAVGSLWASRVASIAGPQYAGDASSAPGAAQVAALRDVFLWGVALMGVALVIGVYGLAKERELRRA